MGISTNQQRIYVFAGYLRLAMLPQYTQFHNYMMYKLPLIGARVHTSNTVYHILFLRPLVDGSRYAQNSFSNHVGQLTFDRFEKINTMWSMWCCMQLHSFFGEPQQNGTKIKSQWNTKQIDSDDDL